jgi:hypothetical protein
MRFFKSQNKEFIWKDIAKIFSQPVYFVAIKKDNIVNIQKNLILSEEIKKQYTIYWDKTKINSTKNKALSLLGKF